MAVPQYRVYEPYGGGGQSFSLMSPTPGVKWLLITTLVAFIIQSIASNLLALNVSGVFGINRSLLFGAVWQLVTYVMLHDGMFHLLINMLFLFMFGPDIERAFGTRRFVEFYFLAGAVAGVGWLAIEMTIATATNTTPGYCIGASGAVLGIIGAFGTIDPNRRITLLVLLVFPVTLTAKTLALGFALLDIIPLLAMEGGKVAHTAHLFGMLTGFLFTRNFKQRSARGQAPHDQGIIDDVRMRFRKRRLKIITPEQTSGAPSETEINRILDKISDQGMRSLTRDERRSLERASNNQDSD